MLNLSKLKKLSSRIYNKGGKVSIRSQLRMLRNLPSLVETTIDSFGKVNEALKSFDKKNEAKIAHLESRIDSKTESRFTALESKMKRLESVDYLASTVKKQELQLSLLTFELQKQELQLSLLTFELQKQLVSSGGALLRETCFAHWWYVLNAPQPHETAFSYLEKIKDLPVTLLDIGANTGISALSVHKCAPKWPIFSIEALSIMEPMLKLTKRHLETLGAKFDYKICGLGKENGGVQSMQVAIVDGEFVDTMATFTPGQFEKQYIIDTLNSISPEGWGGQILSVETEVVKLDSLKLEFDNPHVFIKMDVEGFELEVLPGMREFLLKHKPAILMESDAPEQVNNLLGTMGYPPRYFYYSETEGRLIEKTGEHSESQGNYFFFPENSPLFVGD